MNKLPIQLQLPDQYTKLLGEIIVLWSAFEHRLQLITNLLLDLDLKRGRVAVRDPRPEEHIDMIEQLMSISEIDSKPFGLAKLREDLRKARTERDLLVHGLWIHDKSSGSYYVQKTSGFWKPDAKTPKVNRRINPTGEKVTLKRLDGHIDFLAEQFGTVNQVFDALALMPASQRKPR